MIVGLGIVFWSSNAAEEDPLGGMVESASSAPSIIGSWGGGDFDCVALPVVLQMDPQGLMVMVGGSGAGVGPSLETLEGPLAGGWWRSVAADGAVNYWRVEGDTLVWRSGVLSNGSSDQRLSRC
jgi:hypothetical protein